jgi:hypothetical protein
MAAKRKIRRGNSDMGKFTKEELIEKLNNGRITCYDEIFYPKEDRWIVLDEIKDIQEYASEEFHWKYRISGQVRGPLAKNDLIFFIQEGKILANDWVYHPTIMSWKKLKDIEEFRKIAEEVTTQEEKKTGTLDEALKPGFYKNCPNCGMQNLSSAKTCKGCKYLFK